MKISVIIPTYHEADSIGKLVRHLLEHSDESFHEVVVSDAGSTDGTVAMARAAGAKVVSPPRKGRGYQMNFGAKHATGNILYFLHADAFPPKSYCADIRLAVEAGNDFGNFRQRILSKNKLVRINSFLSRFNRLIASGGDQSLFIKRWFFEELSGYREDFHLMEDYDLVRRARRRGKHVKIPKSLKIIDRKYRYNSFLRVNLCNAMIYGMYRAGLHPNKLLPLYRSWIKGPRYRNRKA